MWELLLRRLETYNFCTGKKLNELPQTGRAGRCIMDKFSVNCICLIYSLTAKIWVLSSWEMLWNPIIVICSQPTLLYPVIGLLGLSNIKYVVMLLGYHHTCRSVRPCLQILKPESFRIYVREHSIRKRSTSFAGDFVRVIYKNCAFSR